MKKRVAFLVTLVTVVALMLVTAMPVLAWWEASTTVNIQGPSEPVAPGSTVTLTVTETNDGDPWYFITEVWVSLEPGGFVLTKSSPFYTGGDAGDDDILDAGETWSWEVPVTVNEDTLFTAIGHGYARDDSAHDVTWGVLDDYGNMAFPNEKFELWVYVTPPDGDEGLTPGYWRNHTDDWPPTGYGTADYFDDVFGVGPHITLLDAVWTRGGGERALIRHATAALLNAAHPNVDYPVSVNQVITLVQDAYASGEFEDAKDTLEGYNELGGDINS